MDSTQAIDAAKRGDLAAVRACVDKGREYDPNKQGEVSNRELLIRDPYHCDTVPDVLSYSIVYRFMRSLLKLWNNVSTGTAMVDFAISLLVWFSKHLLCAIYSDSDYESYFSKIAIS